jgi:hypothetical protein
MTSALFRKWSRSLGDEDADGERDPSPPGVDNASEAATEPDYSFEGYSVEFIDKVTLMPIKQTPTATARWRRRG